MLNSYRLSEKFLNHSKMANLASREEFLEQWEKLRSSMVYPESLNLQTFFADINREIKVICREGKIQVKQPMPMYSKDWPYVQRKFIFVQPKFEAVSFLIRINQMAICPQDKMALSQFVLWVAQKHYSIKPE